MPETYDDGGNSKPIAQPLSRRAFIGSSLCALLSQPAKAAITFSGKTINLIVGFPPGGGVDNGARLMARYLPRFLSGTPNIVIQNMPGAGGVIAGNYLYTKAPRDGLTLGVPGRDWPLVPILNPSGARYQPLEFEYIGSTGEVNTFIWLNKNLGIANAGEFKASKKPIIFGGMTPDTQPSMVAKILAMNGYPIKVVSGYRGTAEIVNAIESGEVDAIKTNAASFARRPDMAEKTTRLMQLLPSKEPLPLTSDFVDENSRLLLKLTGYASATGMPLVAPPGSPGEYVAAYRDAFAKMAVDPGFADEAEKLGEPHGSPLGGEQIKAILQDTINAATPAVLETFRKLASLSN